MDKLTRLLIFFAAAVPYASSATEILSVPGVYVFGSDIVDSTTLSNGALVSITSSNIILDLSEHSVFQEYLPSSTTTVGIEIAAGLYNITIQNGTVGPIAGIGIYIGDGCGNITIQDVSITGCSRAGIFSPGIAGAPTDSVTILNSSITSCTATTTERVVGFEASYTNSIFANNTYFSRQHGGSSDGYGIYLQNCQGGEFIDCRINSNQGFNAAAGVYIATCTSMRINSASLTQNIATGTTSDASCYAIYIDDCTSGAVEISLMAASFCFSGSAGGLYLNNSSGFGIKESVSAEHIGGNYCSGYQLDNGSRYILFDSTAAGIQALVGPAYGIHISNSTRCSVRNNTVLNTNGIPGYGIFDDAPASSSVFIGNYAFDNITNYSVVYTASITLPVISGSLTSAPPGLTSGSGGLLDNISINP